MREFRPPVRSSVLRTVLAVLLPIFVTVPIGVLVLLAFSGGQATYTIVDGALVVRSGEPFDGQRTVPLAGVTEARLVSLRGGRRTGGTALPGLCAGRFAYPDLGEVWQVTDCSARAVLVRATGEDRPILVTPPDPAAFMDALRAGTAMDIALRPADRSPLRVLAFVVTPLAILGGLMMAATLQLGPSRMRYLVGHGAFEVETIFGRKRWPTAHARAKVYTPTGLQRVAGTAAPGYYTGRYRESGQSTRVYATDIERMVLFEGPDRVLVSPEDRVGLLRALEEEGVVIERRAV